MKPFLEELERRDAPSGIADPQFVVFALGGSNPRLASSRLVDNAVGKVVGAASVGEPLPLGDQLYIKARLLFHQSDYHGSATVVAEVPPPGVSVPTDPATGFPTTARYVLPDLGGSVPVIILPDGVNVPQGKGNLWEVANEEAGWFHTDPPGVTSIAAIPPGPDSQSSLSAPNFTEGEALLFGAFAYLELYQPGLLPIAEGALAQIAAATGS